MSNVRAKADIITFKVDANLAEAMRGIENRSEFIRNAILAALDNACPLCGGSGILTPHQKEHWEKLRGAHRMAKCENCDEFVMVCDRQECHQQDAPVRRRK